jgi:hypothetical protein
VPSNLLWCTSVCQRRQATGRVRMMKTNATCSTRKSINRSTETREVPTENDSHTFRAKNPLNHRVQRIQRTNDKTPVDGDWSYSTELSHKSSGESSLDRTNLERSSLHSRANATGSMDSLFSRATDLLIFSTHDFFFPRSKPLKNVKPSQRSEAEIHSMCQKLSKMVVYPHESSVVAQATITSSSIPTKIGL